MCLILRREIVLCSEKEVRQKEQGQTKEMNQSGKPSPELVRICDWEARRTHRCSQQRPSLAHSWVPGDGVYTGLCSHFSSKFFSEVSHTFTVMNSLYPQKKTALDHF